MRKSSLYIIISLLFCNLSCTEYLDVKNKGEVIPETAEEFSALLHRHLYSIDGAGEYAFFGAPSTAASYEAYTDNWDADLTTKLDLPIYVGSDISSLSFRFKSLYEVIRDCNIVIGELKERDTEFGKKLLATAHTIRAVCYYTLMRNYCEPYNKSNATEMLGVPIVKEFDMEGKPERSNLKETADFIVEDLKQAISLNQTDEHYRFYVDVSKAYLARVYFWMQEWVLAASTAKEVLDKYPLISGEAYKEMIQSEVKQLGNVLIRSGISKSEGYVYTDMQKTKGRPLSLEFVNLFVEKERDIRYSFSFNTEFVNTKMLKTSLRTAEMCLIMAESYVHSGDTENGLKYLNHLRENRI
ncbi:MAG: RagB/SusD family nutrient uptake outer membrane protein, partial [Butyricimonas faecihominis]